MTTWRYIKGNEKDFVGYSNEVLQVRQRRDNKLKFGSDGLPANTDWLSDIIAQRERITFVNDDRLERELRIGSGVAPGVHSNDVITERGSKYHREIKPGVWVDVYDVLVAWSVTNPALQHLIKKALQPGERGHKDTSEDLKDILASAKRAIELSESNK